MCLPELNEMNTDPEEEFRLTGSIKVWAEPCLDALVELENIKEELQDLKANVKKSINWINEWLKLDDSKKLDQKSMDFLVTALNTLDDQ